MRTVLRIEDVIVIRTYQKIRVSLPALMKTNFANHDLDVFEGHDYESLTLVYHHQHKSPTIC